MICRRSLRMLPVLMTGLMLLACADDSEPSASASSGGVTSDLLDARESVAQDPRTQMSNAGTLQGDVMDWLNENLPETGVSLDTLGFDFGDPSAPVKILEFSDFGCGYCRQFHLDAFPALHEEYIETGDVYWKYVPMILGMFPHAIEAAQVGECVGAQGLFLEVSDALFERQGEWRRASDPMPVLYDIAGQAGADVDQVRACVEEDHRSGRIAAGTAYATNNNVRGTPTFFILGYTALPGAVPLDLFREILDSVKVDIARTGGPMGPGGD